MATARSTISNSTSDSSVPFEIEQKLVKAIQSPDHEEFSNIRDKYNDVLERLNQLKDLSGEDGINTEELKQHLEFSNTIFDKVKRTVEARLDAKVLKQTGHLAKINIEKTQSSLLTFKPTDYADNLTKFLGNGESLPVMFDPESSSLKRMCEAMRYLYRSTHGIEPLSCALEWDPPEKTVRENQRARREDLKKDTLVKNKIEEVKDSATYEENQSEEVMRIFNVLKRRYHENECERIPFLEFVIDPTCFSTTIQNIFHLSFLIRDRFVEISFDSYKIPHVAPITRKDKETKKLYMNESNVQSVIEMNLSLWKEAIQLLEIKEAMIPRVQNVSSKRCHT